MEPRGEALQGNESHSVSFLQFGKKNSQHIEEIRTTPVLPGPGACSHTLKVTHGGGGQADTAKLPVTARAGAQVFLQRGRGSLEKMGRVEALRGRRGKAQGPGEREKGGLRGQGMFPGGTVRALGSEAWPSELCKKRELGQAPDT